MSVTVPGFHLLEDLSLYVRKFILKIPYLGKNGENLARVLKRKLARNLKKKVSIRVVFTTNKLSRFCSVKDHIPDAQKNSIIYRIQCPGCGESYVGKTECSLDQCTNI